MNTTEIEKRITKLEFQLAVARAVIIIIGIGGVTMYHLWSKASDRVDILLDNQANFARI